jgi:hypothetical protein
MRVLVFALLFVLWLFAYSFTYSQEILEEPIKDSLNGYTAEIPLGWKARNSEYGLIFSKGANFIVIRGKKTTDQRAIAGLLLEELKRTSPTGSIQTAYKKPQTALFYTLKMLDTHTTLRIQPTYPLCFKCLFLATIRWCIMFYLKKPLA